MGSCAKKSEQEPNSYFDGVPDEILQLILNKVLDAKTLVRCLSLSKHFASIIPKTDVVSLPLFLPPRPRRSPIRLTGSPVNTLKYLLNFLFAMPFHLFRRHRRCYYDDSPCQCPPLILKTFHQITHLHFELHSYGGSISAEFLKWKASYGSQLKRCVILCATSFHRDTSLTVTEPPMAEEDEEPEEETTPPGPPLPNDEFKSRIMWTISCLIAASARHFLLKQMLAQFQTLKTIVITDVKKQGRFSMDEEELRDLRNSMKRSSPALFSPDVEVVPDLKMRMWHVPELELPAVGCVLKGATVIVIRPVDDVESVEKGNEGGFDGDASDKAVFEEAERVIVKKKRKSSYVMEMTSF